MPQRLGVLGNTPGLIPAYNSGSWYDLPGLRVDTALSTGVPTLDKAYAYGFSLAQPAVLTTAAVRIQTAGTATNTLRLAIYAGDGAPTGSPLQTFGTIDGSQAANVYTWSTNLPYTLTPMEMYWLVFVSNTAAGPSIQRADYRNPFAFTLSSGTTPANADFTTMPDYGMYTWTGVTGVPGAVGTIAKAGTDVPRLLMRLT